MEKTCKAFCRLIPSLALALTVDRSLSGSLTLLEAGLSLSQTVRNQDSKPFQRVLGSWGGVWLWGPWETLAPVQSCLAGSHLLWSLGAGSHHPELLESVLSLAGADADLGLHVGRILQGPY